MSRIVDRCPQCKSTAGVSRLEWLPYNRFCGWGEDPSTSEAEFSSNAKVRAEGWRCVDCGHRFNKLPMSKGSDQ